jgi:hypothetical protein
MTGYRAKCKIDHPRFAVGQRVERYEDDGARLVGTVVDVYAQLGTRHGDYSELYDVIWDGRRDIAKTYLPHGIRPHVERQEVSHDAHG